MPRGRDMIDTSAETSGLTKYKWDKERYPEFGKVNQIPAISVAHVRYLI